MLTYEEALYHKLLLAAGENDQFGLLLDICWKMRTR